MGYEL